MSNDRDDRFAGFARENYSDLVRQIGEAIGTSLYVEDEEGGVIIGTNGTSISTTEHLLAALVGLGIDNILIEVDGPEIPIMDGSSRMFVDALLKAGLQTLQSEKAYVEVSEPMSVKDEDRWIALYPYDGLKVTLTIEYPLKWYAIKLIICIIRIGCDNSSSINFSANKV